MKKINQILIVFLTIPAIVISLAACDNLSKAPDSGTLLPEETSATNAPEDPDTLDTVADETEDYTEVTEPPATSFPEETESENEPTSPTTPTEPTQGEEITEPTEEIPYETTKPNNVPNADAEAYLDYQNMSGADQLAFIESFESYDAFFAWLKQAEAAYEAERTPINGSPVIP